ncbi:MAG: response regulator [Bryobacterales bacterium]|nr:response regulator [Bryobacterales bacterium]
MKVLLVEDNRADAVLLRETLADTRDKPVELVHVEQLKTALERLATESFDIVLLDLSLPDADGMETITRTQKEHPELPLVVLTGLDDEATAVKAVRHGAQDYLVKGRGDGHLILRAMRYAVERKRSEEALREANEKLQAVIDTAPVAIYTMDFEARITGWNAAAQRMFQFTENEVLGQLLPNVLQDDREQTLAAYQRVLAGEDLRGVGARRRRKDGKVIYVNMWTALLRDAGGKVNGFLAAVTDVTERKQLEEQLRQSQRMEAVGRLAGGVAHDFNNLLTIITGYSDMLLNKMPEPEPLRRNVEEIKKASGRAASLTNQLLAFSRRQVLQAKVIDLNEIVADMNKMLRRLIPESIELVVNLEPQLGHIKADPGQIEQVIVNLAVNAREAMPQGGKLIIETANRELDEHYCRRHMSVKPGSYVMLSVSDTGAGMAPDVQEHIFEPFFTTKTGKGTGLGLSTVYGIVKQSAGEIWVYSEPSLGSSFKIYLPRVQAAAERAETAVQPPTPASGRETILLVEDEETVRMLVREILQSNGYSVLEAKNGAEGLALAGRYNGKIDLLLTDVVMPQMSGRELAEKLCPLRPGTRILFMSGYTDDAVVANGSVAPGSAFIQKPFSPDALARKLRMLLDRQRQKQPGRGIRN